MSPEEKEEEQNNVGAQSALGKITQAGYASLEVGIISPAIKTLTNDPSLSDTLLVDLTKFVLGPLERERRRRKLQV